jgi:hypothetical protein
MGIFRKVKLPARQTQWLNYLKLARKYDKEILEEIEDVEENIKKILIIITRVKNPQKIYTTTGQPWLETGKGRQKIHIDIKDDIKKVQKIKKLMLHRHRVVNLLDDNIELHNNSMNIPDNYIRLIKQLVADSKEELENFDRKILFITRKLPALENYFVNFKNALVQIYNELHEEERKELRIINIEKQIQGKLEAYTS